MYDKTILLNQETASLIQRFWGEFYKCIDGRVYQEDEVLKTLYHILEMSAKTFEYKQEVYFSYLAQKVCVEGIGYELRVADKTPVYFYAECLRGLCEGNKAFLKSDAVNLKAVETLEGKEIRALLSPKFEKLAAVFLANAETKTYQSLNDFVLNEIQKAFSPHTTVEK
ncbi:MAG: hypothetical protein ACHQII_05725 [Bacteroidia bacterium]